MNANTVLPIHDHPHGNCTALSHSPSVQHIASEELSLEVDQSREPIDSAFDINHLVSYSEHPDVLADWERIPAWTPGATHHFSQETPGGIGITTHAPYSDMHSGQGLSLTARGHSSQAPGRTTPSYLHSQTTNTVTVQQLEPQLPPRIIYPDQVSSGQSSAFLVARQTDEITSGPWTLNHTPATLYAANDTVAPSLPLMPTSLKKIPQRLYVPTTGNRIPLQLPGVSFSTNGAPGFNLRRALDRDFKGLDGRDDSVLENAKASVSCRLLFPGYDTDVPCTQIAARNWKKESAPIMKSKLAFEIAKCVRKYLEVLATIPSHDPKWAVGQDYMRLEKMYLFYFAWVSKGSLQPEIWVDTSET